MMNETHLEGMRGSLLSLLDKKHAGTILDAIQHMMQEVKRGPSSPERGLVPGLRGPCEGVQPRGPQGSINALFWANRLESGGTEK